MGGLLIPAREICSVSSIPMKSLRGRVSKRRPGLLWKLLALLFISVIVIRLGSTLSFGGARELRHFRFRAEYIHHFGRPPPYGMEEWLDYADKHQCLTSAAEYGPMYRQLRPFWQLRPPGITPEMLKKGEDKPLLSRVTLRDGKTSGIIWNEARPLFDFAAQRLNSDNGGGSLELWHNIYDEPRVLYPEHLPASIPSYDALAAMPQSNTSVVRQACGYEDSTHSFMNLPCSLNTIHELLPVFSAAVVVGCFADITVPHYLHAEDLPITTVSNVSWGDKREEIVWRGGSSGSELWGLNRTTWLEMNSRMRMVERFKSKPGFDMGTTSYYQISETPGASVEEVKEKMKDELGLAPSIDYPGHWAYKYLLDVDGNSYSRRFAVFLRNSRSLVLKATIFEDWSTMFMRPWKHYVPVSDTLDDLKDKLDYARTHDKQVHRIAEAGFERAQKYLRVDDMKCYLYRLLLEYRRLYRLGHGLPV